MGKEVVQVETIECGSEESLPAFSFTCDFRPVFASRQHSCTEFASIVMGACKVVSPVS